MQNAVLVFATDSEVQHKFCSEADGRLEMETRMAAGEGASIFVVDDWQAKILFEVSPEFRAHVEEAKAKLRLDTKIKNALDDNNVPSDRTTRITVLAAIKQLHSDGMLMLNGSRSKLAA